MDELLIRGVNARLKLTRNALSFLFLAENGRIEINGLGKYLVKAKCDKRTSQSCWLVPLFDRFK